MSDPLFSFEEKVVLVSGGSRGIGRAMAHAFGARGAHVILTGRDPKTLDEAIDQAPSEAPRDCFDPQVCDVAKPADIDRLAAHVGDQYARIDTLINVAGVNRRKPTLDVTEDDYDFIMDINLKGAFLLSQRIGALMVEQEMGNQIQVASLNTDRPLKNVAPYAMSKAALGHLTRSLAMELGPYGVRVNALAPGFILTDLTRKLWSDETMLRWGKANTPMRRLGTPEDMVGTALFLASEASAFMTGQTLYVDGGFTAGWSWPIPEGSAAS